MKKLKVVVVTGMSGAGKTTVLNVLEDMGYLTMDNLPCEVGIVFLDKIKKIGTKIRSNKIAVGIDIRSFSEVTEFIQLLNQLDECNVNSKLIFLDATDEIILNRYNLTRRRHPIQASTLLESIQEEREIMGVIKKRATRVIDSSYLKPKELSYKIMEGLSCDKEKDINIHLHSFGFKYGLPIDIDLLFDVRVLPNPYYVEDLKEKTGYDKEIQEYVMSSKISQEYYQKMVDMIKFLIPNYIKDGKRHLSIGIGCSGGKHRSVTFVNYLEKDLSILENVRVYTSHREKERNHWG
jgi:UPF0042 nucleotide-binding protein